MGKNRTPNFYFGLQLASALFGILISLYLLVQHTRLDSGIQASSSVCSLGALADCDVVNASAYSELFGFPLASMGAIFFTLLLIAGLMFPPSDRNFRKAQRILATLAALAVGIDVYLAFIQIVALKTVCLFCFLTYACVGVYWWAGGKLSKPTAKVLAAFRAAFAPSHTKWQLNFSTQALGLLAILSTTAMILLIPSAIWLQSHFYSFVNNAVDRFYSTWKDAPSKSITIKKGDGQFGNRKSKIKIVEFSDFECPHCQKTAFTLHSLLPSIADKVHVIFKNYPLDSSCNSSVVYQVHPNACRLAKLAYCANKKGQFWEYHDKIFFSFNRAKYTPSWTDLVTVIEPILSKEEITKCLKNPKARTNVAKDIAAGNRLGIKGTPAIFVNGKQITIPITIQTLTKLIELESQ